MTSTREDRPRPLIAALVALGLGLLFLVMALTRPGANIRFHDLVRLLAAGAFLGAGLVYLVTFFGGRRGEGKGGH
jgi:MYXO-CTERM domain-containing protein